MNNSTSSTNSSTISSENRVLILTLCITLMFLTYISIWKMYNKLHFTENNKNKNKNSYDYEYEKLHNNYGSVEEF